MTSQNDIYWYGINTKILHITYFIYVFRNQYLSSLHSPPLRLMTSTSLLRDSSPFFAACFHFGPCRGKFIDIPYVNSFSAIIDERISNVTIRKFQKLYRKFPRWLVLHSQICPTTSKILSSNLKKKIHL